MAVTLDGGMSEQHMLLQLSAIPTVTPSLLHQPLHQMATTLVQERSIITADMIIAWAPGFFHHLCPSGHCQPTNTSLPVSPPSHPAGTTLSPTPHSKLVEAGVVLSSSDLTSPLRCCCPAGLARRHAPRAALLRRQVPP
jgi:hypothetical protein